MNYTSLLKRLTSAGPLRVAKRFFISSAYVTPPLLGAMRWSFRRTEDSNFYYELTELGRENLAHSLATILGTSKGRVLFYFDEVESSSVLQSAIEDFKRLHPKYSSSSFSIGRRLAWYAVARHTRPSVVLETGVHVGLGALVLCLALYRNHVESGERGKYLGTDIHPDAGQLLSVCKELSPYGSVLEGDSISTIATLSERLDLVVTDSSHLSEYEYAELKVLEPSLEQTAIVLADNSHSTRVLSEWADSLGRPYIFLNETPKGHWYPGAGIGISMPRASLNG